MKQILCITMTCLVSTIIIRPEELKAPRPGGAPSAVNAIAGYDSTNLVPVMNMLARILNALNAAENDEEATYTVAKKTLEEVQSQTALLLQQLGFDTLSLDQQEQILALLQQLGDNDELTSLLLSFQALSLSQQEDILALLQTIASSTDDETAQLLVTILAQLLAQQQDIQTLQEQQTAQFQELQTLMQTALAQLTLQQSQLQQILDDIAALTP